MLDRDTPYLQPLAESNSVPELTSAAAKKQALKLQQRQITKMFKRVKQMTIDFYCREDLTITTLKEFFEIFIASLRKDQAFHKELLSPIYEEIGLGIKFDADNS